MKNLLCFVLSMALLVSFSTAQAVEEGFTVFHGSRDEKRIAITVDDCYDSENVQASWIFAGSTKLPSRSSSSAKP